MSETSSESSRPGSAPGRTTTNKESRRDESFPGRKGRAARKLKIPETEHPIHLQSRKVLDDWLTPNEAYGVVALISNMRRNGNVMLKTEAQEGTERVAVYEEDEGRNRNNLVETDNFFQESEAGDMNMPKKVFQSLRGGPGLPKAVQTLPLESGSAKGTQTETTTPATPEERSESPDDRVLVLSPGVREERRTPGGGSDISRPQSLKLSEISSVTSSMSGRTESRDATA